MYDFPVVFIYLIRNHVNGKVYIGKCQQDSPQIKLKSHIWHALHNNKTNMRIHAAIRKYGQDNFSIEVLEETRDPFFLLELERKYIAFLRSTDGSIGYNISHGGDGGE